MVDTTRPHPRPQEQAPPGTRHELTIGTLFVPANLRPRPSGPLWIHFHGSPWLAETAAVQLRRYPVVTVQLGAGSDVYAKPFQDVAAIRRLVAEAEQKAGVRFPTVVLSSWSAGYGAVREFLRVPEIYAITRAVVALDSIHAGYENTPRDLDAFLQLAEDAARGSKRFLVTHSEVFPGTFASTTETADLLLKHVQLKRTPNLRNASNGMQLTSEVRRRNFQVLGFAGNSAPDHEDHMYSITDFVRAAFRRLP